MPVHKIQGGYQYGNTGKKYYGKDAKKKAKLQELAIRLSGYKEEDDEKKKRRYLKHEADSEMIGREFVSEFFGDDHLAHHGVLGMKWGIRRYQPYGEGGYKPEHTGKFVGRIKAIGKNRVFGPTHESGNAVTIMKRLSKQMTSEIKYENFSRLKSHDQVSESKSGDCHSQVMYEVEELGKYGIAPKAKFFIEYDPKTNQGGQTHSFVYYKDPVTKKTVWLENAWGSQKGVHEYPSEKAMLIDIMKKHKAEQSQNREKFTKVQWGDFNPNNHVPGETLQELVNKCLK